MEKSEPTKEWKNVAAATVGRYLGKAKVLIENAARGSFPDYKPPRENRESVADQLPDQAATDDKG